MTKDNGWLKRRVLKWLGLNQIKADAALSNLYAECAKDAAARMERLLARHLDAAIDIPAKEGANTMIVVASRLDGGRVEVFHVRADNLHNLKDHARAALASLEVRSIVDAPKWLRDEWRSF